MKGEKYEFVPTGRGNLLADFGDFKVSYNPCVDGGSGPFRADDDNGETAIMHGGKFYILNADLREKYLELKTFEACIAYFLENQDMRSSWSDDYLLEARP